MAGVVDADTHIAESEAMWKFIDKEMYARRPIGALPASQPRGFVNGAGRAVVIWTKRRK